jgi:hypothetical protein
LTVLIIFSVLLESSVACAQDGVPRYFPETGHWVSGKFLEYYESAPDPLLVYGYPITEAFQTDSAPQIPGLLVQYFQRARFEYRPDNPVSLQVVISPLGEYAYDVDEPGDVAQVSPNLSACRRIPQDGYPVCYAFLSFFDKHGGIAQFGYPISEIELHDGMLVQYFQRARFEWHPERPAGRRVVLTNLGEQYFSKHESPIRLLPNQDNAPALVLSLQAHAFVSQAVVSPDESQTLYVVVQDQNLQPVSGAMVSVVVTLPGDGQKPLILPATNEFGITSVVISPSETKLGIAQIDVTVTSYPLETKTRTSFRIW